MGSVQRQNQDRDSVSRSKVLRNIAIAVFALGAVVLIAAIILRAAVFELYKVHSSSMSPTLNSGEYILAWKQPKELNRGDIAAFRAFDHSDAIFIFRIIGLPGELVEIKQGKVSINGQSLNESAHYAKLSTGFNPNEDFSVQLKSDEYFFLGDNRSNAADSREYGPITRDKIKAKYWKTIVSGKP